MLDRRQFANLPWGLVTLILGIALFGVDHGLQRDVYGRRGCRPCSTSSSIWVGVGIVIMLLAIIPDYHTVGRYAYVLYAVSLAAADPGHGHGQDRHGRPALARHRPLRVPALGDGEARPSPWRWPGSLPRTRSAAATTCRTCSIPGVMVAVPVLLVLKQPDLGTAMMLRPDLVADRGARRHPFPRSHHRGARRGRSSPPPCSPYRRCGNKIWSKLKPYQQNRIKAFIDPSSDPLGSGYHANQSKIAVGSGQLIGKGYRKGTQSQMAFLPERHTDFIFAVVSEERGFVGSSLLLLLYLVLLLTGVDTAKNAKDRLGVLMAGGIVSMISIYVVINVGMAVGVVPVVGVPLPLVSYGGTSIITTFLAIGLLLNIQTRRFMLFY